MRYTTKSQLIKLSTNYTISKINLKISDIKRAKTVSNKSSSLFGVNTALFLKYVWPFYNMHERINSLVFLILTLFQLEIVLWFVKWFCLVLSLLFNLWLNESFGWQFLQNSSSYCFQNLWYSFGWYSSHSEI